MTYLATLHEEISSREEEAYGILSDQLYSEGQIASLCKQADVILRDKEKTELLRVAIRTKEFSDFVKLTFGGIPFDDVFSAFRKMSNRLTEDNFYSVTFFATFAAVHFRNLQKWLPPPDFGGASEDQPLCLVEFMARIALDVSIATLYLTEAGWKPAERLAELGTRFLDGSKHDRMDALSRAMWAALLAYKGKNDRLPTAKQLWDAMPEGGKIEEKEIDTDDNRTIYWVRDNGRRETTSFKLFQERHTTLRRKLKKMQP